MQALISKKCCFFENPFFGLASICEEWYDNIYHTVFISEESMEGYV